MVGVPKGTINNPNGRPVGSMNKATRGAREAIARFVDGNAHRLAEWLDKIAEDNPIAAFDRYMSVVEYHIPKLQRQEITGKDGAGLSINLTTGVLLSALNEAPGIDPEMLEHVPTIEVAPDIGVLEMRKELDAND